MARFLASCLLLLFGCSCVTSDSSFRLGLDMMVRSYDSICWFEALKMFPRTNVAMFNECGGRAKATMEVEWNKIIDQIPDFDMEMLSQGDTNNNILKDLKRAFEESPMVRIPKEYGGNCSKYLLTPLATPPVLEGDALNDGGIDYPYKAFSYCLLNNLRKTHGEPAILAVKTERTHSKKDWRATFLDRDNEFRGLHKSDPFQHMQELSDQAQKWADKLASECKVVASMESDRMWKGQTTGENLVSLFTGLLEEIPTAAYAAAASWYEETKDYPWKDGFKDDDINKIDWGLFGKIKDFTQMIWGSSKMVGYGYSYNSTCAGMGLQSRFVVARYYPSGNKLGVKGQFKANVQPAGLVGAVLKAVPTLLGGLLG